MNKRAPIAIPFDAAIYIDEVVGLFSFLHGTTRYWRLIAFSSDASSEDFENDQEARFLRIRARAAKWYADFDDELTAHSVLKRHMGDPETSRSRALRRWLKELGFAPSEMLTPRQARAWILRR